MLCPQVMAVIKLKEYRDNTYYAALDGFPKRVKHCKDGAFEVQPVVAVRFGLEDILRNPNPRQAKDGFTIDAGLMVGDTLYMDAYPLSEESGNIPHFNPIHTAHRKGDYFLARRGNIKDIWKLMKALELPPRYETSPIESIRNAQL